MVEKEKESTISPVIVNNKRAWVVEERKDNECPVKEGDNCKVPGGFSDSAPIGGG
ncbi:MAG: hypothetical protein ABFC94_04165 [Syntrophomonas sp.]